MITLDRCLGSTPRLAALAALLVAGAGCGTARNSAGDAAQECQRCHGGASGNAAPPLSTSGETATTALGVGAHQAHLARSTFTDAITCGECHVVPSNLGHVDGDPKVTFSGRAVFGGGIAPRWDPVTATCSNVKCHGAGGADMGGSFTPPVWNAAGQGHLDCGSCHGNPPPNHGPNATTCRTCHPQTVKPDGTIDVAFGKHLDGVVEVNATQACDGCHGAPPATGAHLAHVGFLDVTTLDYGDQWQTSDLDPSGAQGKYSFGCGTCHSSDPANHRNGAVDVDLSPASAPGTIKALNGAGAAYDRASGTCSNVYCHSSGQATPAFVPSPGWRSGAKATCSTCHGNPPRYANAGPGAGANSHVYLSYTGREGGHFAGLPGPTFHKSRHGGPKAYPTDQRAAPITCQACHFETVDATNVAPGGLFYLDTSVVTLLPGADPARLADPAWRDTQCATCHDGGAGSPPSGTGKVRPVKHVNGVREVAFDARSAPLDYFTSLGASAPANPYFMTGVRFPFPTATPAGAAWTPAPPAGAGRATLSYELSGATYAPANQTCSSVACHVNQVSVRWGQRDLEGPTPNCAACHAIQ